MTWLLLGGSIGWGSVRRCSGGRDGALRQGHHAIHHRLDVDRGQVVGHVVERTAELIPGARFVLIEGMGHDYPPQLWRQWTDLVVGHIRSHS